MKREGFLVIIAILFFYTGVSAQLYGEITTGSERTKQYTPLLEGKKVGIVANHTSLIGETHLVDSLLSMGVTVKKIFVPEHGFRGKADAGERIGSYIDDVTGLPVVSLYGDRVKPQVEDLTGLDIIVFDIQDVGVRFYTYISTMHYVMEACAENDIAVLILDRPNPNGFYVDGPVLDLEYRSFIGMHPVPVVHGMTIAEYARMINNEGWLEGGVKADLLYVPCLGYDHNTLYQIPVRPSPNLKTQLSVYLYPSLCLFEGTTVSVGRGTDFPFTVYGHPQLENTLFSFVPQSMEGAVNPPYMGQTCFGTDLRGYDEKDIIRNGGLNLEWLIHAYNEMPEDVVFFNSYFTRLIGNESVREMIENGEPSENIKAKWHDEVAEFKNIRKKYLLYKDFE